MAIKTFTTGEVLTASDTNTYLANSGLVYVTSTTFSASSLVSISNAFTSTYTHYVVVGSFIGTGNSYATCKLQKAGTASSTGYYITGAYTTYSSTAVNGYAQSNGASFPMGQYSAASDDGTNIKMEIFNPQVSTRKTGIDSHFLDIGAGQQYTFSVVHAVADAYDGFTITPQGGTNITGTITVYGLRKA
jgi:hypothetical protein